jgi:hypothetical protein
LSSSTFERLVIADPFVTALLRKNRPARFSRRRFP